VTPAEAAEILFPGLGLRNIDAGMQAEIRETFALMVKLDHPDQGGTGTMVVRLKEAKNVLLDHTNGVKPACPVCKGKGTVKGTKFKPIPCPRGCNGKAKDTASATIKRATPGGGKRGFTIPS